MAEIKQTEKIKEKAYDLEERLIDFAVRIIRMVESLPNSRVGNHFAGQLLLAAPLPRPTMVKPKARNRALISFTR